MAKLIKTRDQDGMAGPCGDNGIVRLLVALVLLITGGRR